MHVDDSIIFGNKKDIKEVIIHLERRFTVKTEGGLNDFLGCEIIMSDKKDKCWLLQPHLLKSLKKKYSNELKRARLPITPGTPGLVLHKLKGEENEEQKLSETEQKILQSGTGSLIYLLKHSRPELSNSIRELSKGIQQGGEAHMKEMIRIMKNMVHTRYQGLCIKPTWVKPISEWIITIVTDATSGQPELQGQSVLGIEVYLMNKLVVWKSKTSNLITLSSTEAEVYAATEGIKEALMIKDIMEWMGQLVKTPMKMYIDNRPALNIIRNNYTTKRTKHAAERQWFAKEQFQLGNVEPVHLKGTDISADLLTKNLSSDDFNKKNIFVSEIPE